MEEFKEFLHKCRKVKLIHNGKWYKARTIAGVLHSKKVEDHCRYCEYGERTKYAVVTSDKTFFFIDYWDGCLTSSDDVKVEAFEDESELESYLKLNNHFCIGANDAGENSHETDSY